MGQARYGDADPDNSTEYDANASSPNSLSKGAVRTAQRQQMQPRQTAPQPTPTDNGNAVLRSLARIVSGKRRTGQLDEAIDEQSK